eukprot:9105476-Pyramimonas_sp.AAC.1
MTARVHPTPQNMQIMSCITYERNPGVVIRLSGATRANPYLVLAAGTDEAHAAAHGRDGRGLRLLLEEGRAVLEARVCLRTLPGGVQTSTP